MIWTKRVGDMRLHPSMVRDGEEIFDTWCIRCETYVGRRDSYAAAIGVRDAHQRVCPGQWVGYFDKLCALCDAVLPDFPEERLIRIGWTQDFDGAWICPREHPRQENK